MMLAVVSAVAIIYSIVIVYVPAKTVLDSNLQGPKMCTSLSMAQEVTGVENCEGWTSCHEWCLSKVSFSLKKMGKKLEKNNNKGRQCIKICTRRPSVALFFQTLYSVFHFPSSVFRVSEI